MMGELTQEDIQRTRKNCVWKHKDVIETLVSMMEEDKERGRQIIECLVGTAFLEGQVEVFATQKSQRVKK